MQNLAEPDFLSQAQGTMDIVRLQARTPARP